MPGAFHLSKLKKMLEEANGKTIVLRDCPNAAEDDPWKDCSFGHLIAVDEDGLTITVRFHDGDYICSPHQWEYAPQDDQLAKMMTNKPAAPPPFTVPNNKTVLDCPAEPLPRITYPKAVQYLLELAARGESLGYSTTFITLPDNENYEKLPQMNWNKATLPTNSIIIEAGISLKSILIVTASGLQIYGFYKELMERTTEVAKQVNEVLRFFRFVTTDSKGKFKRMKPLTYKTVKALVESIIITYNEDKQKPTGPGAEDFDKQCLGPEMSRLLSQLKKDFEEEKFSTDPNTSKKLVRATASVTALQFWGVWKLTTVCCAGRAQAAADPAGEAERRHPGRPARGAGQDDGSARRCAALPRHQGLA